MILRLSEKADQSLFKVPYELLQLREAGLHPNQYKNNRCQIRSCTSVSIVDFQFVTTWKLCFVTTVSKMSIVLLCDLTTRFIFKVRAAATSQLYTSQEKLSHRCKKPQSSSRSKAARSLVRRVVRDQ